MKTIWERDLKKKNGIFPDLTSCENRLAQIKIDFHEYVKENVKLNRLKRAKHTGQHSKRSHFSIKYWLDVMLNLYSKQLIYYR